MEKKEDSVLHGLRVPAFCPVCEQMMKGRSTYTYYDWGCCFLCYIQWIEGSEFRRVRWTGGWRPSPEEISSFLVRLSGTP